MGHVCEERGRGLGLCGKGLYVWARAARYGWDFTRGEQCAGWREHVPTHEAANTGPQAPSQSPAAPRCPRLPICIPYLRLRQYGTPNRALLPCRCV